MMRCQIDLNWLKVFSLPTILLIKLTKAIFFENSVKTFGISREVYVINTRDVLWKYLCAENGLIFPDF